MTSVPVQVRVPALFRVRPSRNLLLVLMLKVAPEAILVEPVPDIEPAIQLRLPVTVRTLDPPNTPLEICRLGTLMFPARVTLPPETCQRPAPEMVVPTSRVCKPVGKLRTAPAATLNAPLLVPPL